MTDHDFRTLIAAKDAEIAALKAERDALLENSLEPDDIRPLITLFRNQRDEWQRKAEAAEAALDDFITRQEVDRKLAAEAFSALQAQIESVRLPNWSLTLCVGPNRYDLEHIDTGYADKVATYACPELETQLVKAREDTARRCAEICDEALAGWDASPAVIGPIVIVRDAMLREFAIAAREKGEK